MTKHDVHRVGTALTLPEVTAPCVFVGAASAVQGSLVALCINDSDDITTAGQTITVQPNGTRGSMFSNVTSDYSYFSVRHGIFGVLQENATSLGIVPVCFRGLTRAQVRSRSNATWVQGYDLSPGHTSLTNGASGWLEYTSAGAVGATTSSDIRTIGFIYDTTSASAPTSTGTLCYVLFDGINGFGTNKTSAAGG